MNNLYNNKNILHSIFKIPLIIIKNKCYNIVIFFITIKRYTSYFWNILYVLKYKYIFKILIILLKKYKLNYWYKFYIIEKYIIYIIQISLILINKIKSYYKLLDIIIKKYKRYY